MIKVVLALCALFAVAAADWKSCGSSSDHMTISSLTISPAELARGQPFSIDLEGTLDETVTSGTAVVSVQFLGVTVYSKSYPLCDLVTHAGKSCPIAAGPVSVSQSETFPSNVPKGSYTGKIVVTDQNGAELSCVTFSMKVTAPSPHELVLDDALINHVNTVQKQWVAGRNARFEGVTVGEIKKMLRTRVGNTLSTFPSTSVAAPSVTVPASFDARQQWPNCIHPIRDQQQCGSCWAFSASEVLSDRFCIDSQGSTNVVLSPQWLVSCDSGNMGCQGGYLDLTWQYLESTGIPTDACLPYTSGGGDSGTCSGKCADGSAPKMYKAKNTAHPTSVSDIMSNLVANGPLQVAFSVYQDFMSYKSGVYIHTSGSLLGGHAVKLVGYGSTTQGGKNVDYWIIANSWSTSWGQEGFFWIEKGVNMCGIESQVYAGVAAL